MSVSVNHIFLNMDFPSDFQIRKEALNNLKAKVEQAPVDIREALRSFDIIADPYQSQVIQSTDNTIRVVAPAGSGKTQTVLNRVIHRVKQGLNPSCFLILTFDNAAATSLKTKFQEQFNNSGINPGDFYITTLNAFGYGILRQHVKDEFKPVIQDFRQRRLLREVMDGLKAKSTQHFNSLPKNIENRFYLEFFSLFKNELFDPRNPDQQRIVDYLLENQQAIPFFPDLDNDDLVKTTIQSILWLFMAYDVAMQREGLLDFDDQKLRAYSALIQSSDLRKALQSKYSEIIVDEFQDINLLDFVLVKVLAEKANLVVTGDDDQAIYGFRGCRPDFIIDLERHTNRPTTSFELQINYRNPSNLISYANRLIQHNKNRIAKNPVAHRKDVSEIKVVSTLSAGLEAKFVITLIKKIMQGNVNLKFNDFAVLYRTNAQSLPFQVEFILNDIPYNVRDKDNILTNETLEKLLGVLRLKLSLEQGINPSAKDAVLTILSYFRYVDKGYVSGIEKIFNQQSFLTAITSKEFYSILPKAANSDLPAALKELVNARSLLNTLDILSKRFNGLKGMIGSLEDVMDERVPLGEIYEVAASFDGNTQDFVSTIERALEKARQTDAGKNKEYGIALLTYFKAKGLQWHTVILTTCNDGLIPHKRAPIEDERRLFYVAMTRASANLVISYVNKACNNSVAPSRFIQEAGLLSS